MLQLPEQDTVGRVSSSASTWRARVTVSVANLVASQPWLLSGRIDHVLVSPQVRVLQARRVLTGTSAPVISDHDDAWVELLVEGSAQGSAAQVVARGTLRHAGD